MSKRSFCTLISCMDFTALYSPLILCRFIQVGTPICIPQRDFIDIGRIASIENNHKPVDTAKKGQKAAIKVWDLTCYLL